MRVPLLRRFMGRVELQGGGRGEGADGMDVDGAVGGDAIVLHEDKK